MHHRGEAGLVLADGNFGAAPYSFWFSLAAGNCRLIRSGCPPVTPAGAGGGPPSALVRRVQALHGHQLREVFPLTRRSTSRRPAVITGEAACPQAPQTALGLRRQALPRGRPRGAGHGRSAMIGRRSVMRFETSNDLIQMQFERIPLLKLNLVINRSHGITVTIRCSRYRCHARRGAH